LKRKFAYNNQGLAAVASNDDDNSEFENDPAISDTRKRKRAQLGRRGGGRIPKGEDFWSKADAFFKEKVLQFGDNLTAPAWKEYALLFPQSLEVN
jgi:hypothetical protein